MPRSRRVALQFFEVFGIVAMGAWVGTFATPFGLVVWLLVMVTVTALTWYLAPTVPAPPSTEPADPVPVFRYPEPRPEDRTQAFFHPGYKTDMDSCCASCRAHHRFGILTTDKLYPTRDPQPQADGG